MTVYRDHSEISRMNRQAAREAVRVEPRLFALLELAVAIGESTVGAFDITSAPLTKVWGFHRRLGRFPTQTDLREALQHVGVRWLELDRSEATIRFRKPGVEINLGGIGKGHALDRCAEQLAQAGVRDYLIQGGQSSVLARGSRAGQPSDDAGWTIAVRHPLRPEKRVAEVRVKDRALGTSGSGSQFFHHRGRRYGHVLDPRTGWPAEGVLSTTVLAPTAAMADALATAFFVMGLNRTRRYCEDRDGLSAIVLCPGERSGSVEVHAIGLSDSDWSRLG
jgi:thiamine biosynthesis lipoprotein